MKKAFKILTLGVAIAASATLARADTISPGSTISVTGDNITFNPDPVNGTVTFPANTSTGGNYQVGSTTDTFANFFTTGNPITFFPNVPSGSFPFTLPLGTEGITNMPPGGSLLVLSTTEAGETLDFYLTSESWTASPDTTGNYTDLLMTGLGYFTLTGATDYTQEVASFNFTTQQTPGGVTENVTFSGTGTAISATPEPSSLALLGTTLLGAAAFARRRFLSRLSA